VRALVILRLQQAGYRVQGAMDASDALGVIDAKGSPDLVVLDVNMPGLDGFGLLARLRKEIRSNLPAVFLSGRMQPEDIALGRALGAKYLTKPWTRRHYWAQSTPFSPKKPRPRASRRRTNGDDRTHTDGSGTRSGAMREPAHINWDDARLWIWADE